MQGLGSLDSSELEERLAEMGGEVGVGVLAVLRKVDALATMGDRVGVVNEALGEEHVQVRDCQEASEHGRSKDLGGRALTVLNMDVVPDSLA